MLKRNRITWLIILGVGVLALVLLAASLPEFQFNPDQTIHLNLNFARPQGEVATVPGGAAMVEVIRIIYLIAWILLPVSLIYLLLSPTARKRLLKDLLRVLPLVIFAVLLYQYFKNHMQNANPLALEGLTGAPGAYPQPLAPQETFSANPNSTLVLVVSLVVAITLIGLIAWLGFIIWRRRHPPETSLSRLARQAARALDTIFAGGDLRNTIIRCYVEMSRVLNEEHNIRRDQNMTPREFETFLSKYALPKESVRQLTRLFEDARYSDRPLGEPEERQAILSLTDILEACRSLQ